MQSLFQTHKSLNFKPLNQGKESSCAWWHGYTQI